MSSNDNLQAMSRAWEVFARTGKVTSEVIRPEVARSWQRCYQLKLDPRAPKAPVKLNAHQLAALREENQVFRETALPFMEFLCNAVRDTGFILVLTDRNSVVLELFGDDEVLQMARSNNFVPGSSRAEYEVGTNGISLALSEHKPIQLTGAEHFNYRHHHWTCASAPVFGADNQLLGTVTLSGPSVNAQRHTLGMVISAAEAIHDRLCERAADQHRSRIDAMLSSILTMMSEAIITIDGAALVTNVNPTAAKMLDVHPEQAVGKSVLQLFPGNPQLMEILSGARETGPIEVMAESSKGRTHFVVTPFVLKSAGATQGAVLALRERKEFLNEVREFSGFEAAYRFENLIGHSPALRQQIELARAAARQNTRILISGETGTGKELFAQAIHNASPRSQGPFVAINCAAIPRELLESELFGYKGGAFTGSRKSGQIGKFELADGGTLFLDEVNQMPLDLQAKLLRVLQDGFITRLGDSKPIRIDVRIIAATNEDLYEKSRNGLFRSDLYFRLSVVELNLPALRERGDDMILLAEHMLAGLSEKLDKGALKLSVAAKALLRRYPWSGNVRELENVLEMAAIVCDGDVLEPAHLAYRMKQVSVETRSDAPTVSASASPLKEAEIDLIRNAMKQYHGNIALVARQLKISRSTIYRRMKEHGIIKSFQIG
ncbi:MAG: sigma-54-dependent Fis family transcriptional regulator [Steroidobacteraceae bacterium]